jgi:hypothetical protein
VSTSTEPTEPTGRAPARERRGGLLVVTAVAVAALVVAVVAVSRPSGTDALARQDYLAWIAANEGALRRANYDVALLSYGLGHGNLTMARAGVAELAADASALALHASPTPVNARLDAQLTALVEDIPLNPSYGPEGYGEDPYHAMTVYGRPALAKADTALRGALASLDALQRADDTAYGVSGDPTSLDGWPDAISHAVLATLASDGGPVATQVAVDVQVSTVDGTWAIFHVNPLPAYVDSVQAAYGFAHLVHGRWRDTGLGSADVGCAIPGYTKATVPYAVIYGFGQGCPS